MKKIIISSIILTLIAIVVIIISFRDLNREHVCIILNLTKKKVDRNSFCESDEIHLNGFNDSRMKVEKGRKFKWMIADNGSASCFFGTYSLSKEIGEKADMSDELKIGDSNVHDIEKPIFPDIKPDIVVLALKVEGDPESLEEEIEEIFLHFQTDFRQPDLFYIYGTKIPDKIKLFKDIEINYLSNLPELLITDLTIIRSDDKKLYLKNNGTKRVQVK